MREIKFRAWDKKDKEMFCFDIYDGCPYHHEKDRRVVMQYTGLKDKNGKEIYEGDIVRFISWINEYNPEEIVIVRPVKFENGCFSPVPTHEECEDGYYSWGLKDFEIIGNIHENPELIK